MSVSADSEDIEYQHFSTFINFPACSIVEQLKYEDRCHYVSTTPECIDEEAYVNYIYMLYCGLQPRSPVTEVLSAFTLLSLCLVMFIILGMTAEYIFCPALKMMSKVLGLNEHLAGITLLAFGNGSPDLFTSLASLNDSSRLLFSDLFGAGIYVTSLVGGIICILAPFKMQAVHILRDVCFFLLGAVYIEYIIISNAHITIAESVGVLMIYISYLLINFTDQILLKRYIKILELRMTDRKYLTDENIQTLEELREEAGVDIHVRSSTAILDVELTRKISYIELNSPNQGLFHQFIYSLNPIDMKTWRSSGFISRLFMIIKSPFYVLLMLLMPITDYELNGHGWSKLLNCLQVILLPTVMVFTLFKKYTLLTWPVYAYVCLVMVPFSLAVFFTSRTDLPPRYHPCFALLSVLGSMFVIYTCAEQTVQMFYVLGIVTNSSNAFLGCTLLGWGNSIGDLVANVSMARAGLQNMGFAACYGGPLFNSLLAIGSTFLYKSLMSKTGNVPINQGALGENCFVFLTISLMSTLVWSFSTNFCARRSVGVFLVLVYVLFFVYTVLGEAEIIQTFAPEVASGLP